ncbi:hypothetical protein FHEFKHOI_00240 [Candidatus Methanoperedenaceae archaeon GB50]|nr:MAG: hypothetical protein DRN85_10505 [Methanosarcinales archaeon]CAD7768373.1 hypothetical protein AIOGIFDO_00237 [Candidatus Methanoperedenaceae archaeon GB37]CAD7768392.1 hypothetical protein FHEFKHOI_00240 [Candidatus Methanoperedenaceae archaeon GB50]
MSKEKELNELYERWEEFIGENPTSEDIREVIEKIKPLREVVAMEKIEFLVEEIGPISQYLFNEMVTKIIEFYLETIEPLIKELLPPIPKEVIEFLDSLVEKIALFIKELLPPEMTEFLMEEIARLIKDLPIEITESLREKTYQGLMMSYGRSLSGYNIVEKKLQAIKTE